MRETDKSRRLEDRILGDEWVDWQPDTEGERIADAPKRLFAAFSFAQLALVLSGILLLWYLSLPRLKEFGSEVARFIGGGLLSISVIALLWYLLQVASAAYKLKLLPAFVVRRFPLRMLLPGAVRVAKAFGISRDRIGNSFVKFHNDLMYATKSGRNTKKFLLLLPRCLSAETRRQIKGLCDKYKCKAFTAFGGDEARKIIGAERPYAVIGVACERDLISGIQDTAPKIPVLGLPNRRPEGPCKNTYVDVGELEKMIKFCAGL